MSEKKSCIFCEIINDKNKARIAYEDEHTLAFYDINPVALIHIVIVPKIHLANVNELEDSNIDFVASMFTAAKNVAFTLKVNSSGYRLVINNQSSAGQTVFHLHMHFLAGRDFFWPPG